MKLYFSIAYLTLSILNLTNLDARVTPQRRASELRYHFGIVDPVLRAAATFYSLPQKSQYGWGTSEAGMLSMVDISAQAMVMINNQYVSDSVPFKRPALAILGINKSALGTSIYSASFARGVSCDFAKKSPFNLKGYYHFGISRVFITGSESQVAYTSLGAGFSGYGQKIGVSSSVWAMLENKESHKVKTIVDVSVYSICTGRLYYTFGLNANSPALGLAYLSKRIKAQGSYNFNRGVSFQLAVNICSE